MDLRDQWRKEKVNRMIRDDEKKRNGWKSILIGGVTIAGLVGIITGSMCARYCAADAYDPASQCIERHYRSLDYKVSPEMQQYINRVCGRRW